MTKRQRRVTSADVAREVGVSRATVSYTLNHLEDRRIPQETRKKVVEAAKRLGYQPFAPARALSLGQNKIVLIVVEHALIEPMDASMLELLSERLTMHGYSLVWYVGLYDGPEWSHPAMNLSPTVILSALDEMDQMDSPAAAFLQQFNAPIIPFLSPLIKEPWAYAPAQVQATYLLDKGHQHLAFAAPGQRSWPKIAQYRFEGIRRSCLERGITPPSLHVIPQQRPQVREALSHLLAQQPRPTAICAYNDVTAMAVLAGLSDLGVRVPDEVAVIGFDNNPQSEFTIPSLTTVGVASIEHLTDMLIERILAASRGDPVLPLEPPLFQIIERAST